MSQCRSCGAEIIFGRVGSGKGATWIPLDSEPHPEGNVKLVLRDGRAPKAIVLTKLRLEEARTAGHTLYRSHFASCPDADFYRRNKREEQELDQELRLKLEED